MKYTSRFSFFCVCILSLTIGKAQPTIQQGKSGSSERENLDGSNLEYQESLASIRRLVESERLIVEHKAQLLKSTLESKHQSEQLRIYIGTAIALLALIIVVAILYAKLRLRNAKLLRQSIEIVNVNRELQKNLAQRQILVNEVQHRVNNNLQVISSFLEMQAENCSDKATRVQFLEGKNRVVSIAIVHDLIYSHDKVVGLNLNEYVSRLTSTIKRDLWRDVPSIIHVECTANELPINIAIPLGILINELLTNSFKHARVDRQELEIFLNITEQENEVNFFYADNGTGAPENYEEGKKGLGMKIVRSMIRQLHARSETSLMGRFEFTMIFKYK